MFWSCSGHDLGSWLKIFKYFRVSRRLMLLWYTHRNAFHEVLSISLVFFVILSGFAFSGHLLFGDKVRSFHNWTTAVSALMLSIIGSFEYEALRDTSPTFAPIFVSLWIFIVFFVLVNMFIAVISDYRASAKDIDVSEAAQW